MFKGWSLLKMIAFGLWASIVGLFTGQRPTAPAEPGRGEKTMSWAAIMAIVVEIIKQRSAAGWPLLKMLLDYFGWKVLDDAEKDETPITVGAAPDALKDQIIAWLEAKKAAASLKMKFVYAALIRFLPQVIDQIWDSLFAKGHVNSLASDFPPMMTAGVLTEAELFANLD